MAKARNVVMFKTTLVPVLNLTKAYHIGTLKPSDKGHRGSSLEGHGLSISQHPDAWVQIAKLGGFPWWKLNRKEGRFLDYHSLEKTALQAIQHWAEDANLLIQATRWKVEGYDEEAKDACYCLFNSKAEAEAEASEYEVTPLPVTAPVATEVLSTRMGFRVDDASALELGVVCWCESQTDLDGVWWNDVFDPYGLSAPRGVILPHHVQDWKSKEITPFKTDY